MKDLITIFFILILSLILYFNFSHLYLIVFLFAVTSIKYLKYKSKSDYFQKKLKKQREYFIELLNHDLRIPTLAELRGIEFLEKDFGNNINQAQKEIIGQIKNSCKYSLNMVSMLINTYQIENNSRQLVYEKFSFCELLFKCFDELTTFAKEKEITFCYTIPSVDTIIEADRTELKNVIYNLLLGAINYSKYGEKIKVNIEIEDKNLLFSIINNDFANYLKDIKNTSNYTTIGHNIEMYLCKRIIEFHKGKLFVNNSVNSDKAFSFEIPRVASIYN